MKLNYLISGLLLVISFGWAQEDASSIMDRIMGNLRGDSQIATLEMTVTRPDKENSYTMRIYSQGEDKGLTRVIAPARDAGQAFLNDGDNIFIYNPRLKRVLRLPPSGQSDSFLGSDISYNDLAGDDLRSNYELNILEDTETSITLELIPLASAPTPYGKVQLTAEKPSYAPTHIVYFDQRDTAVKENILSDYAEVEGKYIPQRFEVNDLLKDGNKTIITWKDAQFGVTIPDACFSQNALEREGMCEP
ncbi:MAG: outer membrane lipoprotein-sorting protein [Trueperaceae bacterium]|nr:outer membrane lipoprotein-sorting protein [Trueperaceae bacterium]